jgi:hypothetical protein
MDATECGQGRVEQTELFSADETWDISIEFGSAVTTDYPTRKFNGTVNWVDVDPGVCAKDADHLVSPEERLHVAMALQ